MSLIEKAAERLEKLRQAEAQQEQDDTTAAEPRQEAGTPVASAASRGANSAATAAHAPEVRESRQLALDLAALNGKGFVTPLRPHSETAEEFRVIKRPLLRNVQGRGAAPVDHANLIMITSALPREGKTFSAINLAMSIAMEYDHTVLLVDADVARPKLHSYLGLQPQKGLMDLLSGKVDDLSEVMLRTNVDKLTLLPAGMPHPKATELLASEVMKNLLEEMATRYPERVIIFDSPPLLATTEAQVLATHMGQVVMVVESSRTPRSSVVQALDSIENCPVRMTMLNKIRGGILGGGYGYGYYGYGHRTDDMPDDESVKLA